MYDGIVGIQWRWQSLDSISIKAPLVGNDGLDSIDCSHTISFLVSFVINTSDLTERVKEGFSNLEDG